MYVYQRNVHHSTITFLKVLMFYNIGSGIGAE